MTSNETTIAAKVADELARIADRRVATCLSAFLVPPRPCWLDWHYGHQHPEFPGPTYPGFVVAEFPESGTGIAYSDYGFAPRFFWGLIWIAKPDYGDDAGWFNTLEDAFRESMAFVAAPAS